MTGDLARTVLHRHRFARIWGLGDRKAPAARTPCLVAMPQDLEISPNIAPFLAVKSDDLPAELTLEARLPLSPPNFDELSPNYSVNLGHVLPPSLEEANAGERQGTSALLPVSWQRMNHDPELMDTNLRPEIVVLTDAVQLAGQPKKLVDALIVLKQRFPGALLWAPGLAGPDNIGVLAWMGVDLFDTGRSHEACAAGALLTMQGPRFPLAHESSEMESQHRHWRLALDELHAAIEHDSLRTLAERQSLSSPRLVEHLRYHDAVCANLKGLLTSHVHQTRSFPSYSSTSFLDPLVIDWERFMIEDYEAPEPVRDVMILLPCSARKPYRLSKSHGRFLRAIGGTACHEVMMTSPLGLVPRDLEDVWPASHYDVPVTGDWTMEELARVKRMLIEHVAKQGYQRIINHTDMDLSFLKVDVVDTRKGRSAGDHDALGELTQAVKDAVATFELRHQKNSNRLKQHYMSIARKQHRNDAWLNEIKVRGKLPRWRLEANGEQMAVWSIDRNGFSFSRASIDLLGQHRSLPMISLHDDVVWKGDVFSHLVKSYDADIRQGDDLLVMQGEQVLGLARASAPAWEWNGTPGSLAKSHQRRK
ncbi:MAG: DUF5591 domain-containing protein [Candidatus Poseidonia sp.]|nr:DUF5591 domain-containing protein [Poseidonia sp.]